MRDHGSIGPAFWTGATGRKMRKNKDARILATYLITCPNATAIGIYYLAIPTILHETGLAESEFTEAMRWLSAEGVAFYDVDREWVWVPKMAFWQIGSTIKPSDNKRHWVPRQLTHFRGHTFHLQFLMTYGVDYGLADEMAMVQRKPSGPPQGVSNLPEAPPKGVSIDLGSGSGSGVGVGIENPSPAPARDPGTTEPLRAVVVPLPMAPQPPPPPSPVPVGQPIDMVPDDPHRLLVYMRVVAERLHPELGFWSPGRFADRDAVNFFDDISDRKAAVPIIVERVWAFFQGKSEEKWTAKEFFDRFNQLSRARSPPRSVVVGQARASEGPHRVGDLTGEM